MTRTFILLSAAAFLGSGLYLYQAKHAAELERRDIRELLSQAEDIRAQATRLVTDWQLENDPQRLTDLTARFLPALKQTAPTQFTTLADFERRLPPVGAPPKQEPEPVPTLGDMAFNFPPAPGGRGADASSVAVASADTHDEAASEVAKAEALKSPAPPAAKPIVTADASVAQRAAATKVAAPKLASHEARQAEPMSETDMLNERSAQAAAATIAYQRPWPQSQTRAYEPSSASRMAPAITPAPMVAQARGYAPYQPSYPSYPQAYQRQMAPPQGGSFLGMARQGYAPAPTYVANPIGNGG